MPKQHSSAFEIKANDQTANSFVATEALDENVEDSLRKVQGARGQLGESNDCTSEQDQVMPLSSPSKSDLKLALKLPQIYSLRQDQRAARTSSRKELYEGGRNDGDAEAASLQDSDTERDSQQIMKSSSDLDCDESS